MSAFASGLFWGWIKARQAGRGDAHETVQLLLAWMDDDAYGFCNDLEREAVKAFDKAGLTAFERVDPRTFLTRATRDPDNYLRQHWGGALRAILAQQGRV